MKLTLKKAIVPTAVLGVLFLIAVTRFRSISLASQPLCQVMDEKRLKAAIARGFDVNSGCCTERMIGECSFGRTKYSPLVFAVESGDIEAARALADHGADVNRATDSGYPLGVAASLNRIEIVRILLGQGANKESKEIAVRMAAHFAHADIAKAIIDEEIADKMGLCGTLACSLLAELDQTGSLHLPLQRDLFLHIARSPCLDPNLICTPHRLLSRLARFDDNAPIFQTLVDRGADLDAKENSGKSARDFIKSFWDYDSRPKIKAIVESR